MINETYNNWTILCFHGRNKRRALCRCSCGTEKIVNTYDVRSGKSKRCKDCSICKGKNNNHWKGCGDVPGRIYSAIKKNAEDRDLPIEISIDYIAELFLKQGKKCALSGLCLSFDPEETTASLDRINSSKGYVPGNVQWVRKDINIMKWSLSNEEFINWCNLIANYNE